MSDAENDLREMLFKVGYVSACNDLIQALLPMMEWTDSIPVAEAIQKVSDKARQNMENPPTLAAIRAAHSSTTEGK